MHNIGKFTRLAYQPGNGGFKFNGKTIRAAAHHISLNLDLMIKIEQGKSHDDGLVGIDVAAGADKNAIGANALYNITELAFLDGIFCDDVGCASWILAPVLFRGHCHFIQICLLYSL